LKWTSIGGMNLQVRTEGTYSNDELLIFSVNHTTIVLT
jgi:hypothetical protein